MSNSFPHYRQLHAKDCGAVCLKMVAEYFGKEYSVAQLMALANQRAEGVSLLDLSNAAEQIGMHTVGAKLSFSRLIDDIPLPGIAHWKDTHFVVVVDANEKGVTIADPGQEAVVTITVPEFLEGWTRNPQDYDSEGIILLLEPTADFFSMEGKKVEPRSMKHFWQTALKDKRLLFTLGITLLAIDLLTVTFPFILQMTVDEGIEHNNEDLIYTILAVWLILFACLVGLDSVRRFLLFHIGSKVNIRLLTDLMKKLVQLPSKFYQSRMSSDVIQTLYDNPRVQRFFIQEAVPFFSASLLLLLYSLVLLSFDRSVFVVLFIALVLQAFTIWFFVKKRKLLNHRRHELTSDHYTILDDLIRGIREVKINNAEMQQRWIWERSEARLHGLSKSYAVSNAMALQIPSYLGDLRNIIVIVVAAIAVTKGSMTIGVLIAIVFILTQLGNPVKELIQFLLSWQEVRMSLERMNEIHNLDVGVQEIQVNVLPDNPHLIGENVSFSYPGEQSPSVLNRLDFNIPYGKTTLIIGPNGSGKSTLLSLLLNFQQPDQGQIKIGELNLTEIEHSTWMRHCGVVQQDGHIFTASIARNIALGDEVIDSTKLLRSARIANLFEFLDRFKDGLSTLIGEGGTGLSKGQRQSILIARAVYHDPEFLFLDEATNDLDSENERIVMGRILKAFAGRTVVIVSSRMNDAIRADNVIPLAPPRMGRETQSELSSVRGGGHALPQGKDEMVEGSVLSSTFSDSDLTG